MLKLGEHLRLHPLLRGAQEPYRYEREVEEFLRWSPHVKQRPRQARLGVQHEQLHEMQRLLTSFAETAGLAGQNAEEAETERPRPSAPAPPRSA